MAEIIINKEKHECAPAVAAYVKELKKENARLEEGYQKSVGVIAATDCAECKDKPVKHGRWKADVTCSKCGFIRQETRSGNPMVGRYCPNCGAKMDGGADNVR